MTGATPEFGALTPDDLNRLIEGPDADKHLASFLEKGVNTAFSQIRETMKAHADAPAEIEPTYAFELGHLVPPPKRKAAAPKKARVSTVAAGLMDLDTEDILIPLRPIDKKAIEKISAIPHQEPVIKDTGKVPKRPLQKTQNAAPVAAVSEPKEAAGMALNLQKISGELLEKRLKERQDKMGDIFKDKGTVS